MKKNKPEMPPEFTKTRGREVMSTLFGFQKDVMIALYCPKKNAVVNMLSTMHNQPDVDENSEKKKPDVILCYNETKSGVDIVDKMVKTYSTKRISRRWPLTIFYNMVDLPALNAFIVWQELNGKNSRVTVKQRRSFLLQLSSELAQLVSEIHTGTSSANNPQQSSRQRQRVEMHVLCHLKKEDAGCVTDVKTEKTKLSAVNVRRMSVESIPTLFAGIAFNCKQ